MPATKSVAKPTDLNQVRVRLRDEAAAQHGMLTHEYEQLHREHDPYCAAGMTIWECADRGCPGGQALVSLDEELMAVEQRWQELDARIACAEAGYQFRNGLKP